MSDISERLTEYLLHGGLFNPELMQHDKVRDLLIDCRKEIASLRLTDEERAALEKACDVIDNKTCGDSTAIRNLLERLK